MSLIVAQHPGATALLDRAMTWLEEQEACNDRLLGLCCEHAAARDAAPGLWLTATRADALTGALAYVPGNDVRLASQTTPAAASALAAAVRDRGLNPALVSGPPRAADHFARRFVADDARADQPRARDRARLHLRTRIHRLDRVIDPPRPAPGALAPVTGAAIERLLPWLQAFAREATGSALSAADARARLEHDLERRRVFVWRDADRAAPGERDGLTTLVALGEPTRHGARVAMVYTPPERRARGYASAAVAALSRRCLAQGSTHCTLHTDVDNVGAERVYRRLGYAHVGEQATFHLARSDAR